MRRGGRDLTNVSRGIIERGRGNCSDGRGNNVSGCWNWKKKGGEEGGGLKESRGKGQNNNILMEYIYNVDNKHIFLICNIFPILLNMRSVLENKKNWINFINKSK